MRLVLAAAILLLAVDPALAQSTPLYGDDVIAAVRQIMGGERDKGMSTLESLAAGGRTDAALAAGEVLQSGLGGKTNPEKACRYFEQASSDQPSGMHNLALCYEQGVNGQPDLSKAAGLYEKAAQKGFGKSMCALGNLFMDGRGVAADPARSIELCTRGAATGDIDAMTDLGNYYLQGKGVAKNAVKARELYETAASKKQRNAAYTLGQIYWYGDGTPKDAAAAVRWWQVAYDAGRTDAANLLGMAAMARVVGTHKKGEVTPGLAEEIAWYDKALAAEPPKETRDQLHLAREFLKSLVKIQAQ